jgi:hypothetical protein
MTEPMGAKEVNILHTKSDKDSSQTAQHHSLGISHDQASAGDHTHNGVNSKLPLVGRTVSFPITASNPPTQSQVQKCIDALRELGAGQ